MEAKFNDFRKELSSLLDTYVVNEKQKNAVEKYHMELVKKFFDNDITNKDIKRLKFYVNSILPLVHRISETEESDDIMQDLGDLICQIEYILESNAKI